MYNNDNDKVKDDLIIVWLVLLYFGIGIVKKKLHPQSHRTNRRTVSLANILMVELNLCQCCDY